MCVYYYVNDVKTKAGIYNTKVDTHAALITQTAGDVFDLKQEFSTQEVKAQSRLEDLPVSAGKIEFGTKREPGQAQKSRLKDNAETSVAGARAMRACIENKKRKRRNPFGYQKCAHGRSKVLGNPKCQADRDVQFVVKRESGQMQESRTRRRTAAGQENVRPARVSVATVRSQLEASQKANVALQEAIVALQEELDGLKEASQKAIFELSLSHTSHGSLPVRVSLSVLSSEPHIPA